jgi:ectoine hydroxylase-related dioxygenase (phytanoyl-CoA dioxygenase family)
VLSKAQIEEYNSTGALVIEGVLSENDVKELRRVTDEFVERSRSITENDDVFDLEETHSASRPRVRRIKTPDRQHEVYAKLVRHPRLVEVLCDLWGPDVRFHGAKLNMKSAQFGAAVEWHQDWAFYPHTNQDLAAVGIMMDDMFVENGPLMIIPGSHKGPLYDHNNKDGYFVGAFDPAKVGVDMSKTVPLVGPAGSITVHHARTIHGSALNTSKRDRRLLLFQYRSADAWPLMADEQLKTFAEYDAMMVAGRTREPRLEDVPVRLPHHMPTYKPGAGIYAIQKGAESRVFGVYKREDEERTASAT